MPRIKFIICLLATSLLTGCFSTSKLTVSPPKSSTQRQTISKALHQWNVRNKVQLQRHQLIPIDYLAKHLHIKGLIINHHLGTGKTYLALGFAERNANHPVIILAPKFLQAHWLEHLDKYGVKDKSRYRFFGHDTADKLLKENLSNTIVILDEAHRLIEKVRSPDTSLAYSRLYCNLQQAHRILALSGTPIYNDVFDLVYQINLVSGKNIFSFNQEKFNQDFSKINRFRSYWRAHFLESLHICIPLPILTTSIIAGFLQSNPVIIIGGFISSGFVQTGLQKLIPIEQYPLREINLAKLKNTIQQYISYYNFDIDSRFYPKQTNHEVALSYSEAQLDFLYRFYDSRLNEIELTQLLKDSIASHTDLSQRKDIVLNTSHIQDVQKLKPGAGREIGNLLFVKKSDLNTGNYNDSFIKHFDDDLNRTSSQQKIIFPEKFKSILNTINQTTGPVVVYSHYYYNGLLAFKKFLDCSGYQKNYRIFTPDMSADEHTRIINDFNHNRIKILLLHPDIIEGISLKGTRQLHFLDVPINGALQKQIIGRTIRYRSHLHLPKSERSVAVYIWKYVFSPFDMEAQFASRKNWHLHFPELNYYSFYGKGRSMIDKNAMLKSISPDHNAYIQLNTVHNHMETFRQYVALFSIERAMYSQS